MATKPIEPGDEVQLKRDCETKARRIYGDKAPPPAPLPVAYDS